MEHLFLMFRIPPRAWIFVCCECRVLSGRGLCDELITRPEESYPLCCVVVCDLETSRMGAPYIYDISRLRVKFCFKVGLSATETLVLVQKAYGNEAVNRSNVFRWYSRFRDGRELVKVDERGGRPKSDSN